MVGLHRRVCKPAARTRGDGRRDCQSRLVPGVRRLVIHDRSCASRRRRRNGRLVSDTRNTAIAFVGGGRITSALAAGLRLTKDRRDIFVYDRNPEKLRVLRGELGVAIARDLNSAMKTAGMLIVAVRP